MLFYLLWSVPLLSRSVIFPLPIRSLVSCDLQSHSCPSSPRQLFLHYRSVVLPLAVCNRIAVPPFRFAASSLPIRCLISCGLQSHSCPSFSRLRFHLPRVAVCHSLTSRYSRSCRPLSGFLVVCALHAHWSALYNRALCPVALTGCLVIHPVIALSPSDRL